MLGAKLTHGVAPVAVVAVAVDLDLDLHSLVRR
jgi:hypothetical protein